MKYKGYTGVVEFDEEAGTLFGHVIGLRDGITFQGDSVAEVTQAFHDSVDDYLEFCARRGESPEKPFSGQFVLRIDPQLHRTMSHAAEEQGVSLNSLVEETLTSAFSSGGRAEAESASPAGTPPEAAPGKAPTRRRPRAPTSVKRAATFTSATAKGQVSPGSDQEPKPSRRHTSAKRGDR